MTTCLGKSTSAMANVKHCVIVKGMFYLIACQTRRYMQIFYIHVTLWYYTTLQMEILYFLLYTTFV